MGKQEWTIQTQATLGTRHRTKTKKTPQKTWHRKKKTDSTKK